MAMENNPLRGRIASGLALAAGLGGAVYVGSLWNGFAYDDPLVVEENAVVRSGRPLEAFRTPYHYGPTQKTPTFLYRPVSIASLALQSRLHGLEPAGYHAVHVLLHAGICGLVFAFGIACGVSFRAALAGALLFAVHPVHAEAVASVAGRADLLATAFSLLALLSYLGLRGFAGAPAPAGLLAFAFFYFAALLSKESPVLLPAVPLAWELLRPRPKPPGAVLRTERGRDLLLVGSASAVAGTFYLLLRRAVLGGIFVPASSMTPIENPMMGLPVSERLMTGAVVFARFLGLLFFPWRLSPDYGFAEITAVASPGEPRFLAAALLVALVGTAAIAASRRSRPAALLVVFFLSSWIVVSNLLFPIGTALAERLLYLPSVPICLLLGIGWEAASGRLGRAPARGVGVGLLVLASIRTVGASSAWKDDFHLFSAAEKAAPRSVRVLGNLGVELARRGRLEEARDRLARAVEIAPGFVPNRVNLAGVYLKMGALEEAERELRQALEVEPDHAIALLQLGVVLERRGDLLKAEEAYARAASRAPALADPKLRLAGLLLSRGEAAKAASLLESVLAQDPRSVPALHGLGLAAIARGEAEAAVVYLKRAAALSPGDPAIARDLERARVAAGTVSP